MNGWFWVRIGAILGFLAVSMGAFGAHSLKVRLETLGQAANYQTAATYQMSHALAILAVGALILANGAGGAGARTLNVAGWAFLVGVLIFSGSLYILALTGLRWLGAITPIGGVAMLVGWAALAVATFQVGSGTEPRTSLPRTEAAVAGAEAHH